MSEREVSNSRKVEKENSDIKTIHKFNFDQPFYLISLVNETKLLFFRFCLWDLQISLFYFLSFSFGYFDFWPFVLCSEIVVVGFLRLYSILYVDCQTNGVSKVHVK